jgi:hypothetical protein
MNARVTKEMIFQCECKKKSKEYKKNWEIQYDIQQSVKRMKWKKAIKNVTEWVSGAIIGSLCIVGLIAIFAFCVVTVNARPWGWYYRRYWW